VIAAARFGHLPAVFLPAGPMASGLPNDEKAKARQRFAAGEIGREDLLAAEMASYHAPGICTFYGTANTNQMLMEVMGLHLPGASHANPAQNIRNPLTVAGTQRVLSLVATGSQYTPVCQVLSERAFVNGVVGLHATGGSTNLAIHLIAMARAAGVILTWQDIADLSNVVPLISRVYPNGLKDINHFYAAGGLAFVVNECLNAGLMHNEVKTVAGDGLEHYAAEPVLNGESVKWQEGPTKSLDDEVLRTVSDPFQATGGLVRLSGNLGEAVMKVSAVKPEHKVIEAPARVFHDQDSVKVAFKAGELDRDVVCVVRFQGPRANGMPELHGLTPSLSVLQDRGYKVALVTDGRMSGASGKIPAAIHLSPEADGGGPIARLRDGDIVRIDANEGNLSVIDVDLDSRDVADAPTTEFAGVGRELFEVFRGQVGSATTGASIFT
jgi:phosphogluconate dehydratase